MRKPRFTLRMLLIAVACCAVLLWGAPRVWDWFRELWRTPSAFDSGAFDQEVLAWPGAGRQGNLAGIDEGSCLRVRTSDATGFVIWTDFQWSPASSGGRTSGSLAKADEQGEREVVKWRWKASGGGTLFINDERYMVDEGALFLVSTQHGNVRLKQIDTDAAALMSIPSDRIRERLMALAGKEKDIGGFFVEGARGD